MTNSPSPTPRIRVISDNDYAGDPDGLFQLAHVAMSPSVDLRGVVSSHLAVGDPFDESGHSAAHGVLKARAVLRLLGLADTIRLVGGSESALGPEQTEPISAGAQLIVDEAMRSDTDLPLYVTLGGGLTELAAAFRAEPAIAGRLTAVWIGGPEHAALGATPPPQAGEVEYNLNIDLQAGQMIFDSDVPLWQVPRNAYRQALVSMTELTTRVKPHGMLGLHLHESLETVSTLAAAHGHNLGETYILGDNPLVLLTALMSSFEMDPSSSSYDTISRPQVTDRGQYRECPTGAPLRVYSQLDVRLMFEDFYSKLELKANEVETD